MEMTDLTLPQKSKQAVVNEVDAEQPLFPCGLHLRFESEQFEVMPALKVFKVGDKVSITAEATVTMLRQERECKTLEMQIERIICEPKELKQPEKMSPSEYRDAREGRII